MTTNEMIIEAITTDSRKRKARFQLELEMLGYKIIKDGSWYISNPKTGKWIDLPYKNTTLRTSNGSIRFGYMWTRKYNKYVYKPLSVIDFVGILGSTRTRNNERYYYDTPCSANVSLMRGSLSDRKYHQNYLTNAMNDYQKQIETITKEYQKKIADAQSHYNWSVQYHTENLNKANANINKLLKR